MSLQNPTAKMSKSDPDRRRQHRVAGSTPDEVRRKLKTAVTDSGREIRRDPDKPGVSNLIVLYAATAGLSPEAVEEQYAGRGYAEFKRDLAEVVIAFLEPIRHRYAAIAAEEHLLEDILIAGARSARERAAAVLRQVYDAVGFLPDWAADGRGRSGQAVDRRISMNEAQKPLEDVQDPSAGFRYRGGGLLLLLLLRVRGGMCRGRLNPAFQVIFFGTEMSRARRITAREPFSTTG